MPLSDEEKKKIDAIDEAVKTGKSIEEADGDTQFSREEQNVKALTGLITLPLEKQEEEKKEKKEVQMEESSKIGRAVMGIMNPSLLLVGKILKHFKK